MHPHNAIARLPIFANIIIAFIGVVLVPFIMAIGPLCFTIYWYLVPDDVIPKLKFIAP